MNHPSQEPAQGRNTRLWAALLVGVVLLLAMGATLIRIQSRPFEPHTVVLPKPAQAPVAQATASDATPAKSPTAAPLVASAAAASANTTTPATSRNPAMTMPVAGSDHAQEATDHTANQAIQVTEKPRPVVPRTPEPAVARPPPAGSSALVSPAAR